MAAVSSHSGQRQRVLHTYIDLADPALLLGIRDGAILLDDHGIPGVPVRGLLGVPPNLMRELGLGIAHEQDLVGALDAVDFGPGAHDPCVVEADHDDLVDALGGDLVELLNVWRDVVGLAARGEGTRNRDEDDFLAGKLLAGVVGLR